MSAARSNTIALAALLGAVALWSGSLSIVRIAVAGATPGTVTFWRCVVGAVVLGLVALAQQRRRARRQGDATRSARGRRPSRSASIWSIACGVAMGMAFLLIAVGMQDVGSGAAGIMLSSIPGLTLVIAAIDGSRGGISRARMVLSLGIGTLAALMLLLDGDGTWTLLGLLALAAAAVAHSFSNVASAHGLEGRSPVALAALTMAIAAVVTAPFGELLAVPMNASVLGAIVALGVLPSGVAYVMYFHGVAVLGARRAAYSNFLVPPVAIASGMVALGELPTLATLAAVGLAFVALAVGVSGGEV